MQIAHAPCWLHHIMYLMRGERKVRCTILPQAIYRNFSIGCRHYADKIILTLILKKNTGDPKEPPAER
jgi:hypothetical protein